LCVPYYIKSTPNPDMNDPGIRYYHLYDTNPDTNGNLNRVGKVFPDQQIVVFDDEEICAAMSYKANRNWTLPAPQLSLITPNSCLTGQTTTGILTNVDEQIWITYRFDSTGFTDSLHCNYYQVITGPDTGCTTTSQNVAIRFGNEFPFLKVPSAGLPSGFTANNIKLLAQKVTTATTRPDVTQWREIDVTGQLSATTVGGYLTVTGLTGTTLQLTKNMYDTAPIYDLNDYITLPVLNQTGVTLNFGRFL